MKFTRAVAAVVLQMPPGVLRIDNANFVRHDQETVDWAKFGTSPGIVTIAPGHLPPFWLLHQPGRRGVCKRKPVKGVRVLRGLNTNFAINATPKQAVADLSGTPYLDNQFVFQNLDGTVIGTIVVMGLQITNPAPAASGPRRLGNCRRGWVRSVYRHHRPRLRRQRRWNSA